MLAIRNVQASDAAFGLDLGRRRSRPAIAPHRRAMALKNGLVQDSATARRLSLSSPANPVGDTANRMNGTTASASRQRARRMAMFKTLGTAMIGGAMMASGTASAEIAGFQPTQRTIEAASIPYAFEYATCLYADADAAPHADCAAERERILAKADPVLESFYPRQRIEAKRSLRILFGEMERQADELAADNKPVAPEVVAFMDCLSDEVQNDRDFQRRVFPNGLIAVEACRGIYNTFLARGGDSANYLRNREQIRNVRRILEYRMLSRDGLLLDRGPRDG